MESEPKKFLSKKRKKVFIIKKCDKEYNKNHPKNSLILISKLVLEFIKQKKQQTGNEITEYVINNLEPKNKDTNTLKNIQRRIYDSINVMNSLGLIRKLGQKIYYIPLKEDNNDKEDKTLNSNEQNLKQMNHSKNIDINLLDSEYLMKINELKSLQNILMQKYSLLKRYEKLSKANIKFNQNNINEALLSTSQETNHNNNYNKLYSKEFKIENIKKKFSSKLGNKNNDNKKNIIDEKISNLDNNISNKKDIILFRYYNPI